MGEIIGVSSTKRDVNITPDEPFKLEVLKECLLMIYYSYRKESCLYLRPSEWDPDKSQVVNHPQSYDLNAMLYDKILELQAAEISYWRQGVSPSLLDIKAAAKQHITADVTFLQFARRSIEQSSRRTGTKQNMMATMHRMKNFRGDVEIRDADYRYLTDFEAYLRNLGLKVNSVGNRDEIGTISAKKKAPGSHRDVFALSYQKSGQRIFLVGKLSFKRIA